MRHNILNAFPLINVTFHDAGVVTYLWINNNMFIGYEIKLIKNKHKLLC